MIKGIIFDLDGTLVDTTSVYIEAYKISFDRELGLPLNEPNMKSKFGKRGATIVRELLREEGIEYDEALIDKIISAVRDRFSERIEDVLLLPGVKELLSAAKRDYKVALATSSRRYAANALLDGLGLRKYFDFVVTAEDVEHAKPDPAIFLKAAEGLGLYPSECVVFEDTAIGIRAGKAAGMQVVGVTTGPLDEYVLKTAGADYVCENLSGFCLKSIL
jgi:HAD superfamily hydrolase (TIGR01509 family)